MPIKYFDDEGKQLRPYPKKYMDPSRFKVGDRIEYIGRHNSSWAWGSLNGRIGTVVQVNPAYGPYPPEFEDSDDGGFWYGQHAAWLSVDFGPECVFGTHTGPKGELVPDTRRGLSLDEENVTWRKVK